MYKISKVIISGFWHRFDAGCEFVPDVNIIIGKNGTGKTTFMNILHATLAVDLDAISANEFDSATVFLSDGVKNRTISVAKIEDERFPFLILEYKISNRKFKIRIFSAEHARLAPHYRRRQLEESADVRGELSKIVSLSSLSVYRLRSSDDYEVSDRSGRQIVSPVDYRLDELMQRLTHYQLELSNLANQVSTRLQKDVLTSILYGKEDSDARGIELTFNKEDEKSKLISAYTQLNAIDADVRRKITFHVEAVRKAIKGLSSVSQSHKKGEDPPDLTIDFQSLGALRGTKKIIEKSLRAKEETLGIFSQIDKFLDIVRSFIDEKSFRFESGDLIVSSSKEKISLNSLSSGEKQLLILLTEALLQREQPHVFLADEPELSLHIEWQRKIIPAIRELNPNAQVIAATHSPEVASGYPDSILDMEELVDD